MLNTKGLLYAACASLCVSSGFAAFNATSKNNMVVYYVISKTLTALAQANGYPGINLGNQCSADVYPGPGYKGVNNTAKNHLLKCPQIQQDLYTCRKKNPEKKILLSLGGGTSAYQLTGATNGIKLAKQLFYMFGPRLQSMVNKGLPRPFDYKNVGFSVDGFDLDIEHPSNDTAVGYMAFVTELKRLYGTVKTKLYLTGSPQCIVPDANMKEMIQTVAFDLLFIQFYNTKQCSAHRWAIANPSYKVGGPSAWAGFTYDNWTSYLATTPSKDARLFITLPGSTDAADTGQALSLKKATSITNAYYCRSNLGGVAIWDATYAASNVYKGKNFYQNMKAVLKSAAKGISRCATDGRQKFPASTDGRCGVDLSSQTNYGTTCTSNQCCSQYSYCYTGASWCGTGCQLGYGMCWNE